MPFSKTNVFFPIGFPIAHCHKLLGYGVVVLNFKYQLTHSRRIWRGRLSRSGWPVGMSVGGYLAYIKWGERTQPTAGGTTPQKGDSELQKSREHWRALLCIHPSLCPWVWMSCDQALQGPPISTAPLCCNLDLRVRQTFSSLSCFATVFPSQQQEKETKAGASISLLQLWQHIAP